LKWLFKPFLFPRELNTILEQPERLCLLLVHFLLLRYFLSDIVYGFAKRIMNLFIWKFSENLIRKYWSMEVRFHMLLFCATIISANTKKLNQRLVFTSVIDVVSLIADN